MRRFAFMRASALLFFAVSAAGVARADERPTAHLTYTRDPDITGCPSDREMRDAVAARLGYDPFTANAPLEVRLDIARRRQGLGGIVSLSGPQRQGQRLLSSPSGDCRELALSLAVAIAIGVDPSSDARLPGTPPPLPPLPPPAPAPAQRPLPPPLAEPLPRAEAPPPSPPPEPAAARLTVGVLGLFGEAPATTGAIAFAGGLRYRAFDVTLEGSAALASRVHVVGGQIGGGTISVSLFAASVVPCAHISLFFGCAMATAGALRGEGTDVAVPIQSTQVYGAVGVRAGVEVPLHGRFFARASLDGVAPLTRITLQLGGQNVWTVPAIAARAGLSAGAEF